MQNKIVAISLKEEQSAESFIDGVSLLLARKYDAAYIKFLDVKDISLKPKYLSVHVIDPDATVEEIYKAMDDSVSGQDYLKLYLWYAVGLIANPKFESYFADYILQKVDYLINDNRLAEAYALVDAVNPIKVNNSEYLLMKSEIFYLNADFKRAIIQAKNAINLDNKKPDGYFYLARIYEHISLVEDALINYRIAMQLNPNEQFYHREYARLVDQIALNMEMHQLFDGLSTDN